MKDLAKWVYIVVALIIVFPMQYVAGSEFISPAVALFLGLVFALIFPMPYAKFNKKASKYLLQASVVGLGFGMNVTEALKSGAEGMMFTVVSVIGVMCFGVLIGLLDAYLAQDHLPDFVGHGDMRRQRHCGSRAGAQGQ